MKILNQCVLCFVKNFIVFVCLSLSLTAQNPYFQISNSNNNYKFPKNKNPEYEALIKNPNLRFLIAPLCLFATGAIVYSNTFFDRYDAKHIVLRTSKGFRTSIDDYTIFAPIISAYLMDFAGIKSKNNFWEKSIILVKAELLALGTMKLIKMTSGVMRPDGSNNESFPSGHTTQAFVAATFLYYEYGDKYPWVSIAVYTIASASGLLRIINNRHWLSDVLCGAGIGILSTHIAYKTHKFRLSKRKKTVSLTVIPSFSQDIYSANIWLSF